MTRSDIGTIIIIYAVCLLFLYLTLQLKAAAQVYPLCLIAGLALLDTLYLLRCVARMRKMAIKTGQMAIINDFGEVFKGFQAGQFTFIVGACVAYVVALFYLGFYFSSFLYMCIVMWFLRVKPLQLCLTVTIIGLLIYGVFTLFLKVPLPAGYFFQ